MRKKGVFEIVFDLLVLFLFVPFMFYLNFFSGVFYCVALFMAIKDKVIFKKKGFYKYFLIGTFLSYFLSMLVVYVFRDFKNMDYVSLLFLGVFMLWIWKKSRDYRKGRY